MNIHRQLTNITSEQFMLWLWKYVLRAVKQVIQMRRDLMALILWAYIFASSKVQLSVRFWKLLRSQYVRYWSGWRAFGLNWGLCGGAYIGFNQCQLACKARLWMCLYSACRSLVCKTRLWVWIDTYLIIQYANTLHLAKGQRATRNSWIIYLKPCRKLYDCL